MQALYERGQARTSKDVPETLVWCSDVHAGSMTIDLNGPEAIYRQVARVLTDEIKAGEYDNGPIPSETTLTQRFGIARGTARKAVDLLRDQGLVFTVPQRGTWVVKDEK